MDRIKLGWAEEDITPNKRIRLAGQFYERVSEYVETPISVTALAVECEGEQAVFCSCDLVEIYSPLVASVRQKLIDAGAQGLGLDVGKVILNAIHTHTSYIYTREDTSSGSSLGVLRSLLPTVKEESRPVADQPDIMQPEEALEFLADRITAAVLRAWCERKPAFIIFGFGRVPIAHCRRVVYDDGSALMWGDTSLPDFSVLEGGTDTGMELLFTFDENRKLTGVVANTACPAQVLEHRNFVSSDYWGKTKKLLREKFGGDLKLLALIGAAGDLCPRDLIRWVEPETPVDDPNIIRHNPPERLADPSMFDIRGCEKVAKRVYNEIVSVYEELDLSVLTDKAVFRHSAEVVPLPLRRVTTEEYEYALRVIEDFARSGVAVDFRKCAELHVYDGTVARYRYQQNHDTYGAEMHFLRLGDAGFVSFPFEIFLDYGNKIRAWSPAKLTFLIELACGAGGYLPTQRAERGGHYSAYVSSGNVGHEGGEVLVNRAVEALNKFWV